RPSRPWCAMRSISVPETSSAPPTCWDCRAVRSTGGWKSLDLLLPNSRPIPFGRSATQASHNQRMNQHPHQGSTGTSFERRLLLDTCLLLVPLLCVAGMLAWRLDDLGVGFWLLASLAGAFTVGLAA